MANSRRLGMSLLEENDGFETESQYQKRISENGESTANETPEPVLSKGQERQGRFDKVINEIASEENTAFETEEQRNALDYDLNDLDTETALDDYPAMIATFFGEPGNESYTFKVMDEYEDLQNDLVDTSQEIESSLKAEYYKDNPDTGTSAQTDGNLGNANDSQIQDIAIATNFQSPGQTGTIETLSSDASTLSPGLPKYLTRPNYDFLARKIFTDAQLFGKTRQGNSLPLQETESLAESYGLSKELIALNPVYYKDEQKIRQLAKLERLCDFADQSLINAAFVVENLETAKRLDEAFKEQQKKDELDEKIKGLYKGYLEKNNIQAPGLGGDQWNFGFTVLKDSFREYGGYLQLGKDIWHTWKDGFTSIGPSLANGAIDLAASLYGTIGAVSRSIPGPNLGIGDWFVKAAKDWEKYKFKMDKAPTTLSQIQRDLIGQIPQFAAQMAATFYSGGSSAVFNVQRAITAGTAFAFTNIFGSTYNQAIEKGITHENAFFAAFMNASAQSALEGWANLKILKIAQDSKMTQNLWRGSWQAFRTEATTEGLQGVPEWIIAENYLDASQKTDDLKRRLEYTARQTFDFANFMQATKNGIYEALIGGVFGAGSHYMFTTCKIPEAEKAMQHFLRDKASQVMRRINLGLSLNKAFDAIASMPGNADRQGISLLLENTIPDSQKSLWLETTDLANLSEQHADLAIVLNMENEQIEQAIENGAPLQVKTVDIISANNDTARAVSEKLRIAPDEVDWTEANSYDPQKKIEELARVFNMEDDLQNYNGDAQELELAYKLREERRVKSGINAEMARIKTEMENANISTKVERDSYFDLLKAHALALYHYFGYDPVQYLKSVSIKADIDPSGKYLGRVELKEGQRLIKLFQNKNYATFIHEAGHIFADDLVRIMQGQKDYPIQNLLQALKIDASTFHKETIELISDDLQKILQSEDREAALLQYLEKHDANIANLEKQIAKAEKQIKDNADRLSYGNPENNQNKRYSEENNALTETVRELKQILKASRKVKTLIRSASMQMSNFRQAQADFQAMARFWNGDINLLGEAIANLENADPAIREDAVKIYTQFQESIARGFEKYMATGKTPTARLMNVFSRVQRWLMRVYGDINVMHGHDLSGELAGVFNRMLATESDMFTMQALPELQSMEEAFLDDGNIAFEYREKQKRVLREIQERIFTRFYNETVVGSQRKWEELFKKNLEAMDNDPLFKFLETFRIHPRVAMEFLGKIRTNRLMKLLPDNFTGDAQETYTIEPVYKIQGMGDIGLRDLLERLYTQFYKNGETKEILAAKMTEAEMETIVENMNNEAVAEAAKAYAAYLTQSDFEMIVSLLQSRYRTKREAIAAAKRVLLDQKMIAEQARARLMDTPLSLINYRNIKQQMKNILQERSKAIKDGNIEKVIECTNKLRLGNEMLAQAANVQKQCKETLKKLETLAKKPVGTHPVYHTEALGRLANALHQINDHSFRSNEVLANYSYNELINLLLGNGMLNDSANPARSHFADWLLDLRDPNGKQTPNGKIDIRELTPYQVSELEQLVRFLEGDARTRINDKDIFSEKSQTQAVESLVDGLSRLQKDKAAKGKLWRKVVDIYRGLAQTQIHLFRNMVQGDAYKGAQAGDEPGILTRIYRQFILGGEERVRKTIEEISNIMYPGLKRLQETSERIKRQYGHGEDIVFKGSDGKEILAPEAIQKAYGGQYFTMDQIISLFLNLQNHSNAERVFNGYRDLNLETIAELFGDDFASSLLPIAGRLPQISENYQHKGRQGLFDLADFQAVQTIIDAIGTMWPDIQSVHERRMHFLPEKVQGNPYTITRADGQAMTFRGGYFPIKFDGQINEDISRFTEQELLTMSTESTLQRPQAKKGFTMQRSGKAADYPVLLSTSVLLQHLDEASRYIHLSEAAEYIDALTNNRDFRKAYIEVFGKQDYDSIRPNLRGLLIQDRPREAIVKMANSVRQYVVFSALWGNTKVAALQLSALFSGMNDFGATRILKTMRHVFIHPLDTLKQIYKAAPYMFSRLESIDNDLKKDIRNVTDSKREYNLFGLKFKWQDIVDFGMLPITVVDQLASGTIWLAAYHDFLDKHAGMDIGDYQKNDYVSADLQSKVRETLDAHIHNQENTIGHEGNKYFEMAGDASLNKNATPESQTRRSYEMDLSDDATPDWMGGNLPTGENALRIEEERKAREAEAGNISTDQLAGQNNNNSINSDIPEGQQAIYQREDNLAGDAVSPKQEKRRKIAEYTPNRQLLMEDNPWHELAVQAANDAVKRTNPDYERSGQNSFLRSQGVMRMLNAFGSAPALLFDRFDMQRTMWKKGQISGFQFARWILMEFMAPSVYMVLLLSLIRGYGSEKDKEGEFKGFVMDALIDNASMMIPVIGRPIGQGALALMGESSGGRAGNFSTSLDGVLSVLQGTMGALGYFAFEDDKKKNRDKAAAHSMVRLIDLLTRTRIAGTIENMHKGYKQYGEGRGTPLSGLAPRPK